MEITDIFDVQGKFKRLWKTLIWKLYDTRFNNPPFVHTLEEIQQEFAGGFRVEIAFKKHYRPFWQLLPSYYEH